MDCRNMLQELTGEAWTGVSFLARAEPGAVDCATICEAVGASFSRTMDVRAEGLTCLGARRSLGLECDEQEMVRHMSERAGMPESFARDLLESTLRHSEPVAGLRVGPQQRPDVYVAYLQPHAAMRLLRAWQSLCGRTLSTQLSSFTAVCAGVVAARKSHQPFFSLGCPDSRDHGGIPKEKLVCVLSAPCASEIRRGAAAHFEAGVST